MDIFVPKTCKLHYLNMIICLKSTFFAAKGLMVDIDHPFQLANYLGHLLFRHYFFTKRLFFCGKKPIDDANYNSIPRLYAHAYLINLPVIVLSFCFSGFGLYCSALLLLQVRNPSYYNLEGTTSEVINAYLSRHVILLHFTFQE